MKFRMTGWILGNFKQRLEEVNDDLLEIIHQATRFVHIEQPRDLDKPADVVREQLIIHDPRCELVPLIDSFTIDGNTPLDHLVLAGFEIRDDLFRDLGEISPVNKVVRLEEDGSQSRFTNRVVFKIELVESMERVDVGLDISVFYNTQFWENRNTNMHIERIDTEIIRR
jgi:hypothetical protein